MASGLRNLVHVTYSKWSNAVLSICMGSRQSDDAIKAVKYCTSTTSACVKAYPFEGVIPEVLLVSDLLLGLIPLLSTHS